jgi:hypothetical protein
MSKVLVALSLLALTACASTSTWQLCGNRLTPINSIPDKTGAK